MKTLKFVLLIFVFGLFSCQKKYGKIEVQAIANQTLEYKINNQDYKSFVAFDTKKKGKLPVVMIIPEWWGINDYAKYRAQKIAELGYFAMIVDMYGNAKSVETPDEAQKLAMPFYQNSAMAKEHFDAALSQLKNFKNAEASKIAAIGYCFGGAMVLNMARQNDDLKGVVSFHGNLMTGVKPNNNKVKVLVCNGEADSYVLRDEVDAFKKEMDSTKISYQFIDYPNALHSFTNSGSTEVGKKYNMKIGYNKEADQKSWAEMKKFLTKIFK